MFDESRVFEGIYHDGRRAGAEPARVTLEDTGLRIQGADGSPRAFWPFGQLVRHPDDAEGRMRLGLAKGSEARLAIADPGFAEALKNKVPRLFRKGGVRATLLLALVLGTMSAALIAATYFGVPRAAEEIAPHIPPEVEARIGTRYYQSVLRVWPACTQQPRASHALKDLATRLLGPTKLPFDVTVDVIEMRIENAFALPGGHVLFTRQMIDRMNSSDELAGVLAHELGHVVEHHAMIGVIQQTGMSVLLQVLTGGSSGSGEAVLNTAGELATISFTRRLEGRADAHGLAMLKAAHINPAPIADLFERLEKAHPDDTGFTLPAFLSSHPPTPDRIALARAAADPSAKPALSAEDWAAIKAGCVSQAEGPDGPVVKGKDRKSDRKPK
jgi:predicted Zn-dependent protease